MKGISLMLGLLVPLLAAGMPVGSAGPLDRCQGQYEGGSAECGFSCVPGERLTITIVSRAPGESATASCNGVSVSCTTGFGVGALFTCQNASGVIPPGTNIATCKGSGTALTVFACASSGDFVN